MHPQFITKFFEPNDLKYYDAGSIRFGTLQFYKKQENSHKLSGRFDPNEGKVLKYVDVSGSVGCKGINIANIFATEGPVKFLKVSKMQLLDRINTHIFCSMAGKYCKDRHEKLISPNSKGYPGNPKLTHWITLDLVKFLNEINEQAKVNKNFTARGEDYIFFGPVKYGGDVNSEVIKINERKQKRKVGHLTTHNYIDAIFQKDLLFEAENEFRIALNMKFPKFISEEAEPMSFDLSRAKNVIVELGKL